MKGFKEWKKAQKFDPEAPFTVNEFEELARGIEFGVKVRKILRTIWNIILGVCAILAAVFSILAYFK